ncbi:MAG: DUF1015 domain-containing protein [Clostridiales bacterium]|nr:DUF1015 domain-containing protein [Clostridiales bacterium]
MAVFRGFQALRPTSEKASRVASLPYDVVSSEEAYALGKANPDSFLHVERAEIDCPKETDMYDECVYRKAEENLQKMIEEGTLIEEEKRCFYIYELIRKGKSQTGFVGCSSIDDYQSGVIRRHELTRTEKERDRIRHMEVCCANTSPVFLTCRYTEKLKMLLESWKQTHRPVYDFTAEDEITHRVWIVDGAEEIKMAEEEFGKIPSLYIADGHHRAASAVKTGLKYREENPDYTGEEEFNYFLSVVFPCEQLTILPYHRIVTDLNGITEKAFIGSLKFNFELMLMPGFPCKPVEKHCMGMYTGGQWYHLKAWKDIYENKDQIEQLDVSILQDKVLRPVLGIEEPAVDKRIRFAGGNMKLRQLQEMADETGGVAFVMFPVEMEDIMRIADEGKLMPPKSTWFEPKLRSGLFVHKLK